MSYSKESPTMRKHVILKLSRGWRFVKPFFNQPHSLFKKYRLGIYITKKFKVAMGCAIPYKLCFSLPFLGVNMSYKKDAIKGIYFPEHPLLKIAPNNEQYFAAQVVMQGWESIFDPHIYVHHIVRNGLSKSPRNDIEKELIRLMFIKLLQEYNQTHT